MAKRSTQSLARSLDLTRVTRLVNVLIGVFDLLADAREQVKSVTGYVEALRYFWLAETGLQSALTGRSPGAGASSSPGSPAASRESGAAAH
jgi:hypothetical protein